jgi:dTDP-4-amino-4,6-dideoxygalactose transaminase
MSIPFTKPSITDKELEYVSNVLTRGQLAGDGPLTKKCEEWLRQKLGSPYALMVHSGTAALEMSMLLAGIKPGDEVIMPSFTFVSTANAVVLRGGIPVFVDIRSDTLNIDETKIEEAVTSKTRAILPVHYAGVGAEMDRICEIAWAKNLMVIEDAAQGILAKYKGRALGTIGNFGAVSFHETKNIVSGEGGALLVKDKENAHRAEIIREKGTNRTEFYRKEVAFYTWLEVGSSYVMSDILAALLRAQMDRAEAINAERLKIWNLYHQGFADAEMKERVSRPHIPSTCEHNGHIYYLIAPTNEKREEIISTLKKHSIASVFHYIPLHSSPGGQKYGRTQGSMAITDSFSSRLVRLPLWVGLEDAPKIIELVNRILFS